MKSLTGRIVGFVLVVLGLVAAILVVLGDASRPTSSEACEANECQKFGTLDSTTGSSFGASAAMDDRRAVIGATGALGTCAGGLPCLSGAAYVFRLENGAVVQEAKLMSSDAEESDYFAGSVSISGHRVAVGAHFKDDAAGAAYVFRRDDARTPADPTDDHWLQEAKLAHPDVAAWDSFGISVAIENGWILVGASNDDDACPGDPDCESEAVYVFRLDNARTPADPTDDRWVSHDKLIPSDSAREDYFGCSLAINSGRAVVGALKSESGYRSGTVYVFRVDDKGTPTNLGDDVWVQEAKLTASDSAAEDLFGTVGIDQNTVVVGAPGCDNSSHDSAGAVYVFQFDDAGTPTDRTDDRWIQKAKMTASNAATGDRFGDAVAIAGDRILVGARMHDHACPDDIECNCGAAYLLRRTLSGWVQELKLTASDAARADGLGASVAIAGDRAVAGAPVDDRRGSAYIFSAPDAAADLAAITEFQHCYRARDAGVTEACQVYDSDNDGDIDRADLTRLCCRFHGP
jgi:hypothetical protein